LVVDGTTQQETFELQMNPNETWTQADADARFELWWRVRTITENANQEIIAAMAAAEEAGEGSDLARQADEFIAKLVPQGQNLSQIANEPAKLLSKLTTVHWMLFHSEGRPPQSSYDVIDVMEAEIKAEIEAWHELEAAAR
jgi:hypothetical protein